MANKRCSSALSKYTSISVYWFSLISRIYFIHFLQIFEAWVVESHWNKIGLDKHNMDFSKNSEIINLIDLNTENDVNIWRKYATSLKLESKDRNFAVEMDRMDPLLSLKEEYLFPNVESKIESSCGKKALYLCGNSLGLQPKGVKEKILNQLDKWEHQGVEGHFTEPTPWLSIDDIVKESTAKLVGAKIDEVVVMNSLTVNLHLMMCAFYNPNDTRYKILIEKKAFPSDVHAVTSQIKHRGYDPKDALIEVEPREGETTLHEQDIIDAIELHGSSLAMVLFSGVQYYTGQFFNMPAITKAAHDIGAIIGFDLAHAVGNLPMELHDWNIDFACWCSYKYLNCGPGSLGGCFVHSKHTTTNDDTDSNSSTTYSKLSGWWGHRESDRFVMSPDFIPETGAYRFRLSNPPVLLVAGIRASMDLFDRVGMQALRTKSIILTGYLEYLLKEMLDDKVTIFTPSEPSRRGCQLSLTIIKSSETGNTLQVDEVFSRIQQDGVVCDVRKPDVIRIAPTPMYNSFCDVFDFVNILKTALVA